MISKTHSTKPTEITHEWFIVDATDKTLGRVASVVATKLMGKKKTYYVPHLDCGDNVIIINAANIKVTGNKLEQKIYYHHSGYPGGISEETLEKRMLRDSAGVLIDAVAGMLPKNKLASVQLKRLKVYPGADHPHDPQVPKELIL